jgi:hypothetical protein
MAGREQKATTPEDQLNAACGRSFDPHAQNGDAAGVRTLLSGEHAAILSLVALACFAAAIPLCLLLIQLRADALEAAVDRLSPSREAHAAP